MAALIPRAKQGFLLSVYGILIVELLVTFFVVYYFRNHPTLSKATKQSFITYLLVSLTLIFILTLAPLPMWIKFIVFTLFSIVQGGLLHQTSVMIPKEVVTRGLLGTISVFLAMSVFAIVMAASGIDLSWMGMMLFAGLIGLIIATLVIYIVAQVNINQGDKEGIEKTKNVHKVLLVVGLILFSMYVMYETNIILQKDYDIDALSSALNFYLDFVNIFTRILGLQSS